MAKPGDKDGRAYSTSEVHAEDAKYTRRTQPDLFGFGRSRKVSSGERTKTPSRIFALQNKPALLKRGAAQVRSAPFSRGPGSRGDQTLLCYRRRTLSVLHL